jgi:hypothetical protein
MKNKMRWLRISYWVGAVLDGLYVIPMLSPKLGGTRTLSMLDPQEVRFPHRLNPHLMTKPLPMICPGQTRIDFDIDAVRRILQF